MQIVALERDCKTSRAGTSVQYAPGLIMSKCMLLAVHDEVLFQYVKLNIYVIKIEELKMGKDFDLNYFKTV